MWWMTTTPPREAASSSPSGRARYASISSPPAPVMVTVRALSVSLMSAMQPRSGKGDQIGIRVVPEVLDPVGQDQDPVGVERPDRSLVVGDQDDRAAVAADRRPAL